MTKMQKLAYVEFLCQLVIVTSVYTIAFKVHSLLAGLTLAAHFIYEITGWMVRKEMVMEINRQKGNYAQQINQQIGGGTC